MSAAILFGLIGMLTGISSLILSWQTSKEQSEIVLHAYPTASSTDLTHAGFGLRVELVNQSLRPIIIRSASLWDAGEKISDGVGYLDDVKLLELSNVDPAALGRSRRDFPITLGERQGRTVAVLMDVWTPVMTAASSSGEQSARARLNRFLTRIAGLSQTTGASPREIELRIDSVPGGSRSFPVKSAPPSAVYPEAIKSANAIEKQTSFQTWKVDPFVRKKVLAGLRLRRTFAGTGEVDIVHLDLWQEGSPAHRRISRPVVGQQSTLFPLSGLPPGRYTGTFELDGQVVAYRSFALPWRDSCAGRARALVQAAPRWCGD
jgi:hypothetical protein